MGEQATAAAPETPAERVVRPGRLERLGMRLGDSINPIAVKEMRQAVSGKQVTGVIIMFLLVQTTVVPIYTMNAGTQADVVGQGPALFMVLLGILLGTCLLFVPASTAYRLAAERSDQNVDLMFITTLRPWRIISGKFFSAMVLTLLIYALCMPYLTLAYLMRGIDLPTIFMILGMNLVVIAWCVLLAILLASLPMARFVRTGVQLGSLIVFVWVFFITFAIAQEAVSGGFLATLNVEDWLAMLVSYAGAGVLMFTLAVAAISPGASNRAVLPRLCFMGVWAVTAVALAMTAVSQMWGWLAVVGLSAAMLVAIGERDVLNRRLAARVPRRVVMRVPAFFVFSGAANGIAWTVAMMVATLSIVYATVGGTDAQRVEIFATYAMAYGLAGFVLARFTLLSRWIAPAHAFVVGLVLMSVGAAFPLIAALMTGTTRVDDIARGWWLSSIWVAFSNRPFIEEAVWVGRAATAVMLLAVGPWFVSRVRRFRPLAADGGTAASAVGAEAAPAAAEGVEEEGDRG